ncbi:circadian clock-controlled protein daywake-like [Bicyclus anynana]|uniref:Circadian clock-controlled protein daywake-like n=1 Tax=Bicyclus anynana TaxID=110368 RepID=A0ABM3LPC1_BICAN|nr:circadian clock-controlled protein daywake-like [Bicyclus anynana]
MCLYKAGEAKIIYSIHHYVLRRPTFQKMSEVTVLGVGTLFLLFFSFSNSSSIVFQKKCCLQDSACLTEQARSILKTFMEGDAELGIEKMDKMSIEPVEINKNGLIFEDKNLEVEGLQNSVISNVSVNLNFKAIVISSLVKSVVITGDYTASGSLFGSPVFGDGKSLKKFNGVKMDIVFLYDIEKNKDGNDVVNLKSHVYSVSLIGGVYQCYENAFNNDKEKSDQLHAMINDNWSIIFYTYGDLYFSKIIAKIFSGLKIFLASQNLKDMVNY